MHAAWRRQRLLPRWAQQLHNNHHHRSAVLANDANDTTFLFLPPPSRPPCLHYINIEVNHHQHHHVRYLSGSAASTTGGDDDTDGQDSIVPNRGGGRDSTSPKPKPRTSNRLDNYNYNSCRQSDNHYNVNVIQSRTNGNGNGNGNVHKNKKEFDNDNGDDDNLRKLEQYMNMSKSSNSRNGRLTSTPHQREERYKYSGSRPPSPPPRQYQNNNRPSSSNRHINNNHNTTARQRQHQQQPTNSVQQPTNSATPELTIDIAIDPQINKLRKSINSCKTPHEIISTAYEHYKNGNLPPPVTATFWKRLSTMLLSSSQQQRDNKSRRYSNNDSSIASMAHELKELYHHTMNNGMKDYNSAVDVANVAQSMAGIVKYINVANNTNNSSRGRHNTNHYNHRDGGGNNMDKLYNTFVVQNNNSIPFWGNLQHRALEIMPSFRPKWLVSIGWAFATVLDPISKRSTGGGSGGRRTRYNNIINSSSSNSKTPPSLNVSPFFQALNNTFNQRREDFTSKHMGNLAWSCMMTCRQQQQYDNDTMQGLLGDFANEFVTRRKREDERNNNKTTTTHPNDVLDAMTLCQWANAYSKAKGNDNNKALFQSIAESAIPMIWELDARGYANLSHAFAVAELNPTMQIKEQDNSDGKSILTTTTTTTTTLFDEIAKAAIPRLSTFSSQNMANITWAFAKLHPVVEDESLQLLFDAVAREALPRLKEFSPQQLANLAWALSKCPSLEMGDAAFDGIANEVVHNRRNMKSSFTIQGVSMLANSFATVGYDKSDFWERIEQEVTTTTTRSGISELGPMECGNIAWSFATIGRRSDAVFGVIQKAATQKMEWIDPVGLSMLAWSFGTLGYGDETPDFFEAIAHQSLHKMKDFGMQDVVMMFLGYSQIRHAFPELFEHLASRSTPELGKGSGLDLFNMVVSYGRAGHRPAAPWMEAISNEIIKRPKDFTPQMFVGISWAYASVGYRSPRMFQVIADECIEHCSSMETKSIASMAWSFASVGCFDRRLFESLAASSEGRWEEFNAHSLANMAWAYATAKEDRPCLFESIANAAINRRSEFAPQGLSMLLWACSTSAPYLNRNLFDSLAPAISNVIESCDSQALANIAWSYAVANVDTPLLFGKDSQFISALCTRVNASDEEALSQIHQWNLWRKEIDNGSALPERLVQPCFDDFVGRPTNKSSFQSSVVTHLTSLGLQLEEEALTSSGYRIDAVVDVNGTRIAIEVDGPFHFIGRRPTGSTILKHRQVQKLDNMRVVSIPYWEWNELESDEDKQQYLLSKLGL